MRWHCAVITVAARCSRWPRGDGQRRV